MQIIFFVKNHWFQLLSTKNNWTISLLLGRLSAILSWIMSSFCSQKTTFDFGGKLHRHSSPSHLTRENSVSRLALWLSFAIFVFAFWPIETTTTNLQSLTYSNPCKRYWPSHLRKEHIIISFRRRVTWFTTV